MLTDGRMQDVALPADARSPRPAAVDLEWQSFPKNASSAALSAPPGAPSGLAPSASSGSTSPAGVNALEGAPQAVLPPELASGPEANFTLLSCLSPSFYQTVFDVDTVHVTSRVRAALWPFSPHTHTHTAAPAPTFLHLIAGKPDLYGPFWLATTLIFTMGVCANLLRGAGQHDFRVLSLACVCVYAFTAAESAAVWLMFNYAGVSVIGLVSMLCIFGYGLAPFLPATILASFPIPGLQWVSLLSAAGFAALHVFKAIAPAVLATPHAPTARTALLAAVLAQFGFGIALKFLFF